MLNLVLTIVASAILFNFSTKGRIMESRIDKIDVKRDHQELIALFYRMELKYFVQVLLYKGYNKCDPQ